MLTLHRPDRNPKVLEQVYQRLSPGFNECKYWLVVFSEDSYTIYGLGFNPYNLSSVREGEYWPWPTNDLFHNAASALCTESYEHWKIVEVCP